MAANPWIIENVTEEVNRDLNVLGALNNPAGNILDGATIFEIPVEVGDDVLLSWADQPTDTDFRSYNIYYDAGVPDPAPIDTLLVKITEAGRKSFLVTGLGAGTYRFKVLYEDRVGNEGNGVGGDNGLFAEVVLNPRVDAPTLVPPSFADIGVGVDAHLTFDLTPPVDTSGIVAYYYSTNQLPMVGEVPFCDLAPHHSHRVFPGSTPYSINMLAGNWKVCVWAVDKFGNASGTSEVSFSYVDDGSGALIFQSGATSTQILDLVAKADVGTVIDLSCTSDTPSAGGVAFERDGVEFATLDFQSDGVYEVTDTGVGLPGNVLVSGTEYTYRVRPYSRKTPFVYGEYSETVSEIADGTPPTGDQVLTGEVVN
ncbi:MAG: hypothetical protein ACYTEQ_01360 [Planctomycetota bacterium]